MLEAEILTSNVSTLTKLNRSVYLRASLLKASSFLIASDELQKAQERLA